MSGTYISHDELELINELIEKSQMRLTAMGTVSYIDLLGNTMVIFDGSSVAVPVKVGLTVTPFLSDRVGLVKFGSEWVIVCRTRSSVIPGNETLISEVVLQSPASSVTISNLPQTFRDLRITTYLRDTIADGNIHGWCIRVNSNSSTSYNTTMNYVNMTATLTTNSYIGSTNTVWAALAEGALSASNVWASGIIEIPNYTDTGAEKNGFFRSGVYGGGFNGAWIEGYFSYTNTEAVNSLQFIPNGGTALQTGSLIRVYGVGGVTGQ